MTIPNKHYVKRTQRDYALGFKDAIEKGDMTYKQAQSIYGIQGRSTVDCSHLVKKAWQNGLDHQSKEEHYA